MDAAVLDEVSPQELSDSMAQLVAVTNATFAALFAQIAAFDRRQLWRLDGATSIESWLVAAYQLDHRSARDWAAKARALPSFPATAAAYGEGRLSGDQLRSLLTLGLRTEHDPVVAAIVGRAAGGPPDPPDHTEPGSDTDHPTGAGTADPADPPDAAEGTDPDDAADAATDADAPDSTDPDGGQGPAEGPDGPGQAGPAACDADLVRLGERLTSAHLRRLVALTRPITTSDAAEAHRQRELAVHFDDDTQILQLRGRLTGDDAMAAYTALVKHADAAPDNPDTGAPDPLRTRLADALCGICSTWLDAHAPAHRPTVVVHGDLELLLGADGSAHMTGGPTVAAETFRRMACDCALSVIADGPGGRPVGHGRSRRLAEGWLVDLVRRRDGGCRFPGCGRTLWLYTHHIAEWHAHLGRTDLPNLVSLCCYHHHLVHEGGWRIEGDPDDVVSFVSPTGKALSTRPTPLAHP